MASGTVTRIVEDSQRLSVTVDIGGSLYVALVSKAIFDALLTTVDKQAYIVSVLSGTRRASRQFENVYATLIGTVVVVPD